MELELKGGPCLLKKRWHYDEETEEGGYRESDVTRHAVAYLFETVTLAEDVTLADLFRLLDMNPELLQVYQRNWAKELLDEVKDLLSAPASLQNTAYDPQALEYLELYQLWELDSVSGELDPLHRLNFHGIGVELLEDSADGFEKKGSRIQWGISFTSPRELLHLPLRINPDVRVCESNLDSARNGHELVRYKNPGVTLGQVIEGVLWELSFHGGPEERQADKEELTRRCDEVSAGTANLVAVDLFREEIEKLGTLVPGAVEQVPLEELYRFIRSVPDTANASEAVLAQYGLTLNCAGLTGMELRRLLRKA